jgi:hypothetical protein
MYSYTQNDSWTIPKMRIKKLILKEDGNYSIKSSELGSDIDADEFRQLDSITPSQNPSFGLKTEYSQGFNLKGIQTYSSLFNKPKNLKKENKEIMIETKPLNS